MGKIKPEIKTQDQKKKKNLTKHAEEFGFFPVGNEKSLKRF